MKSARTGAVRSVTSIFFSFSYESSANSELFALYLFDRRKSPWGGGILSDWGAEEEI